MARIVFTFLIIIMNSYQKYRTENEVHHKSVEKLILLVVI